MSRDGRITDTTNAMTIQERAALRMNDVHVWSVFRLLSTFRAESHSHYPPRNPPEFAGTFWE